MKKLIFLLFAALAAAMLAALSAPYVSAEEGGRYARVTEEGVYFYSAADESAGLFILPRTYFVEILGEAGEYYRVRYIAGGEHALEGYCKAFEVSPVDYTPETPYLDYTLTVTYRADAAGLPDSFLTEYTVSADYCGDFMYGSAICYYVRIDDKFGYVPATACSAADWPENPEHTQDELPPEEGNASAEEEGIGAFGIVLVCVLAVAALGAIYFLFRPAGKKKSESAYDEAEDVF